MKGNKNTIRLLNALLADELSAINQYIIHSEMCENWGYGKLQKAIKMRAIEEMKHAERLIARILFLDGTPELGPHKKVAIGSDIEQQFQSDKIAEVGAIKLYNEGINQCVTQGDNGSADLLRQILADEEKHLDWIETQLGLIKEVHIKNYLLEHME